MKKIHTVVALVMFLLLFIVSVSRYAAADGSEILGPPSIDIAAGSDFITAGAALPEAGMAAVGADVRVDVPANATIKQTILYWSGASSSPEMGDAEISVMGQAVSGTLIGGPTKFYRNAHFYTYRADITALNVIQAGSNVISVNDVAFDVENNGTSIIVIYDDGRPEADIQVFDGLDLAYDGFGGQLKMTEPRTFTFEPSESDRVATLWLAVGSVGQDRPNKISITVGNTIIEEVGLLGETADSEFWDNLELPVDIPAGVGTLSVEVVSFDDETDRLPASLSWITIAMSLAPAQETPPPCVNFAGLPPGSPVTGLGTVHPNLNISTTGGELLSIVENVDPIAYWSQPTPDPSVSTVRNGSIGPRGGFFDRGEQHNYIFEFAESVGFFSVRARDFGDWNPQKYGLQGALMVAYDANGNELGRDLLQFSTERIIRPTFGSAGNLQITGEAGLAQEGEPGNRVFSVFDAENRIARIQLDFFSDENPEQPSDTKFALADLCLVQVTPEFACADFAALGPGISVVGPDVILPGLTLNASGNAVSILADNLPQAYVSQSIPDPNARKVRNGSIGDNGGFVDIDALHEYEFVLAPGSEVGLFSIRLRDFGDWNSLRAKLHSATLTAYDAANNVVARDLLQFSSDTRIVPRTGSAGDLSITGEAGLALEGQPGNRVFRVYSPDNSISRVELSFASDVDPNRASDTKFGLADLCMAPLVP